MEVTAPQPAEAKARLIVLPDPQEPMAVFAKWVNASGDYRLLWDDGTSTTVPWRSRTVRHLYSRNAVYHIKAERLDGSQHAEVEVTVPPAKPSPGTARIRWWAPSARSRTSGDILLSGFPPRAVVDLRFLDQYTENLVRVDANGALTIPSKVPDSVRGSWFTVIGRWADDDGTEKLLYQPVKPHAMVGNALVPTYNFADGNPRLITLRAYTGRDVLTRIYWGDGLEDEITPDGGWIELTHEYAYDGRFGISVQEWGVPDGRMAYVTVSGATAGEISHGPDYVDYNFFYNPDCNKDAILRAEITGPQGLSGVQTYQSLCSNDAGASGVRFRFPEPGEYVITFRSAMQDPITVEHLTQARGRGKLRHEHKKENPLSRPPILVPEGYANPENLVDLRLLHTPGWYEDVEFRSEAFEGGKKVAYPATIVTDELGRCARAAGVPIADCEPGTYEVSIEANGGDNSMRRWLLVEAVHDGIVHVTGDKPVKPNELVQWQYSRLSRNTALAWTASEVYLNGRDPSALSTINGVVYENGVRTEKDEDGKTWYALVYEAGTGNAHQGIVVSANAVPGKQYKVEVAQEFTAGHREIVAGSVTVPMEAKPLLPGFTIKHKMVLDSEADTIVHKIHFGGRRTTNTQYFVGRFAKCLDAQGKPAKPSREDAAELLHLNNPYHIVRHLDHVELHTVNPHKLRGNDRLHPYYVIAIEEVADDSGYSEGADNGDEEEHNGAPAA